MIRRVLITGCSGFIGSHLVAQLVREGYEPLGVDVRPPTNRLASYTFAQCDILDGPKLRQIVGEFRPDAVLHLAARTDLGGTRDVSYYAANIQGTQNVIESIIAVGTVRRALFTSSQLVCKVGYSPSSDTDYCPVNLYGESKVLTEKIVRAGIPAGITWCLLRPTTIWGEGMSAHYQRFLGMVRAGRYFHIGHDPLYKSYGYVGNSVYQYIKFMNAGDAQIDKKTFYIADYEPLSLTAWVDALALELGAKPPWSIPAFAARFLGLCGDAINGVGFKSFPFNSFRIRNILTEYVCDLTETKKVCGALPFSVNEGISRTARWFSGLRVE